ncbi:MAG: sortase [Clostridia bacterium]|nr:sortase [Clostridia bacterium]
MNQILVSEKLYVTPELKRKKKVFRFEFFISVFLLCILSSYAIYAEYDRNKSEAVSKDLLENINYGNTEETIFLSNNNNDAVRIEDDAIVVILNKALENSDEVGIERQKVEVRPQQEEFVATDGSQYTIIGEINIPSLQVNYPIIEPDNLDNIDTLLKISVCKFHGANPNEVGNLCIVGHNYKNSKFFSKVPNMNTGDIIEIKDLTGTVLKYSVYDKFIVEPDDVACTTQLTNGKKEITLITCTNDNKQRYIVKAREI